MAPFAIAALILILVRWAGEIWLSRLNEQHVRADADAVPAAFQSIIDEATYQKSVHYTLAKARFSNVTDAFDTIVLVTVLFSGVLPWAFHAFTRQFGISVWSTAALMFAVGAALAIPGLPFDWYSQFKLEERFGFNTTTRGTWILDRVKGLLL